MSAGTASTPRNRELLAMPDIASQMPIRFANGNVWAELTARCPRCDRRLEPRRFTGEIRRPSKDVAIVEAIGHCDACAVSTPFHLQLHDNLVACGWDAEGHSVCWPGHAPLAARLLNGVRDFADRYLPTWLAR